MGLEDLTLYQQLQTDIQTKQNVNEPLSTRL